MKLASLTIVALLTTISLSAIAKESNLAEAINKLVDKTPTCRIYDGVSTPRKAVLQKPTKVSEIMLAMLGSGPLTSNTNKYEIDGLSIELAQSVGCAMGCWNRRIIMVTAKGISTLIEAEKKTLNGMYPTISQIIDGQNLAFQCAVPSEE